MFKFFNRLKLKDAGQALVEYGLIIALVSLVAVVTLGPMGDKVSDTIEETTNKMYDEGTIVFEVEEDDVHEVIGRIGYTLDDYHRGDIPSPKIDGQTFIGWVTKEDEIFGMDTEITNEELIVTPKWELNEVISKIFELSEEGYRDQQHSLEVDNAHEIVSLEVDKGNIDLAKMGKDEVDVKLTNRPYDRRELTGGKVTEADSKTVSGQNSSSYNEDGYTGNLSSYVYSGSYTPSDTKYVSGQTNSNYNSGGYSGTLSRYQAGGSYTSADSKYVSGQTSSYYNSGGYSGSLSRYLYSGSYTPSDSKTATGTDYSYRVAYATWRNGSWNYPNSFEFEPGTSDPSTSKYVSQGGYSGWISHTHSTRLSDNWYKPTRPGRYEGERYQYRDSQYRWHYSGTITRPASDTRTYRYSGTVSRPYSDTRYYRYRGNVTRPSVDTRVWRYRGTVNRPYSDTRTWDHFYKYTVTVRYREK